MRSNATTTPSASGRLPPDRPVAEPRATSGTWRSLARRTMAATSAVDVGRTTARGVTGSRVRHSSWVSSGDTS